MSVDANPWDKATLLARIDDAAARRRFPAGSPDETDIAMYAEGLRNLVDPNLAVVLGMTPELRRLAAVRFRRVVAIDRNPEAIALYREWLSPGELARETVLTADWIDLPKVLDAPAAAVLGDGVFGNLADIESHRQLLIAVFRVLRRGGRFVTRMALIPRGFDPEYHSAAALLARFRAGRMDEAEFGFGMRLVGHYRCCYDPGTCLLDNAKLFAECADACAKGEISQAELSLVRRYYFGGKNCIIRQDAWEALLAEAGYRFRLHPSRGKEWREYYPVYECVVR